MQSKSTKYALMLGALGVVYGDIGTSPLYAVTETFFGHYQLAPTQASVLGVASLILWSLIIIVTIKYVGFILRMDNNGEGGVLAFLGLLMRAEREKKREVSPRVRMLLVTAILIGASLLYGEGMITPAISVLSAVEGVGIISGAFKEWVIPITVAILTLLFYMQHKGTHRIGFLFGPVMAVWFATLALLGLVQVVRNPVVLAAINPWYAVNLVSAHGWKTALILGSVVLCVTGVEALFADLGHFGRGAISRGWLNIVFPSVLLNYFGQTAFMLSGDPVPENNIFFAIVPVWGMIPMVALATVATVIASQSLISGAFSLTQQAIALGLFPRLKIVHTNPDVRGQIYLPFINYLLLVGCLFYVLVFQKSTALAAAYGVAVTGTMMITTIAFTVIARTVRGWKWRVLLPLVIPLFMVDVSFFSSNMLKFDDGGYMPFLTGLAVFMVMDIWRWGRTWIGRAYQQHKDQYRLPLQYVIEQKRRFAGTFNSLSVVVMSSRPILTVEDSVPPVMAIHYRNWQWLPKNLIFMSIVQSDEPFVPKEDRYKIIVFSQDETGTVVSAQARYGYMESPNVRRALLEMKRLYRIKIPEEPRKWLILIGSERFVTKGKNLWEQLRIAVFSRMNRFAKPVTDYFGLETDHGVTMETINV